MRKVLGLIFGLVIALSGARAQSTLSGTVTLPNGQGFTGVLNFSLAQNASASTVSPCTGPGLYVPTEIVQVHVNDGTLASPPTMLSSFCTIPIGVPYNVTAVDSNGNVVFQDQWLISGSTFDVGTAVSSNPSPTVNYQGIWQAGSTYSVGDIVSYDSLLYVSTIMNNLGNIPAVDTSVWQFIGSGGPTITLTTLGTSGASTYISGTLNIPQYQGQLTLTTIGSSGAATLSGDTLNIPEYSGVSSLNSLTGALTLESTDSSVTITPSGSTIDLQAAGGGGSSEQGRDVTVAEQTPSINSSTSSPSTTISNVEWIHGGNSIVAADTGSAIALCGFANQTFAPASLNFGEMRGGVCRYATTLNCDSVSSSTYGPAGSYSCQLAVNNADGMFQAGNYFTPSSQAVPAWFEASYPINGGSYAPTSTYINFATEYSGVGSGGAGSYTYDNYVTTSLIKFGQNGGLLSSWMSNTLPDLEGWGAASAEWQAAIAAGRYPVLVLTDGMILTNDIRTSAVTYEQSLATRISAMNTIEALSQGSVTMTQRPIAIDTGNANGCVYTQDGTRSTPCQDSLTVASVDQGAYIFPLGTTGTTGVWPGNGYTSYSGAAPVSTSGAATGGSPTVATVSPCDPLLWSPGMPIPTTKNASGALTQEGVPMMVVLDTSTSGVQELVGVTSILDAGSGNCYVGFTPVHNHSSGYVVVTSYNTAAQTMSVWKRKLVYDIAALYPNVIPVDTQTATTGRTINVLNGDELHPLGTYGTQENYRLQVLEPKIGIDGGPFSNPYVVDSLTQEVYREPAPPIPGMSSYLAAWRRVRGGWNPVLGWNSAGQGGFNDCLDDHNFDTVGAGVVASTYGTAGTYDIYITTNLQNSGFPVNFPESGQTGDYIWTPLIGCWQPASLDGFSGVGSPSSIYAIGFTGTLPISDAVFAAIGSGPILVRRPKYTNPLAGFTSPFKGSMGTSALLHVYSTSTTDSLVMTLDQAQPSGTYLPSPSLVSIQAGDALYFAAPIGGSWAYEGIYSGATAYTRGQVVSYNYQYWIAETSTTGSAPTAGATWAPLVWTLPTGGSLTQGTCTWIFGSWYSPGCLTTWADSSGIDYSIYSGAQVSILHTTQQHDNDVVGNSIFSRNTAVETSTGCTTAGPIGWLSQNGNSTWSYDSLVDFQESCSGNSTTSAYTITLAAPFTSGALTFAAPNFDATSEYKVSGSQIALTNLSDGGKALKNCGTLTLGSATTSDSLSCAWVTTSSTCSYAATSSSAAGLLGGDYYSVTAGSFTLTHASSAGTETYGVACSAN